MLDLGGGGLNFRNAIINGNCRVGQYGTKSLTNNVYTYGGCDRITAYPNGFTTMSGSVFQATAGLSTTSGFAQAATITTTGAGSMVFATRLEAKDTARFAGRTVTISAKVYHDVGSSVPTGMQLYKANVADTFGAVTQIGTTVSTGNAANNVYTLIQGTFTLGSTDAANGLLVHWQFQSLGALTSKTFAIGDLQLTEGTVVLPIEVPPIQYDTALCQRYFVNATIAGNVSAVIGPAFAYGTTAAVAFINLPVSMRVAPSVTTSGCALWNSAGGSVPLSSLTYSGQSNFQNLRLDAVVASGLVAGNASFLHSGAVSNGTLNISAEL